MSHYANRADRSENPYFLGEGIPHHSAPLRRLLAQADGIGVRRPHDTVVLSDSQVKHAKPKRIKHGAGFEAQPHKLADAQGHYLSELP